MDQLYTLFTEQDAMLDIAMQIRPKSRTFKVLESSENFYRVSTRDGEILCFSKVHIRDHTAWLNQYLTEGRCAPNLTITVEHNIPPVLPVKKKD